MLDTLFGGIVNIANQNVIKFDEANVRDIRSRLSKVQSRIDGSATYINNITAESDTVWTGVAASNFLAECKNLITKTDKLSTELDTNIKELDTAITILAQGNSQAATNVNNISDRKVFKNL